MSTRAHTVTSCYSQGNNNLDKMDPYVVDSIHRQIAEQPPPCITSGSSVTSLVRSDLFRHAVTLADQFLPPVVHFFIFLPFPPYKMPQETSEPADLMDSNGQQWTARLLSCSFIGLSGNLRHLLARQGHVCSRRFVDLFGTSKPKC